MNAQRDVMKKSGIWLLVYAILCAGLINFCVILSFSLVIIGVPYFLEVGSRRIDILPTLFGVSSILCFLTGFLLSLAGSVALVFTKIWGKKISILGIRVSFIFAFPFFIYAYFALMGSKDAFTIVSIWTLIAFLVNFISGSVLIKKLKQI